MWRRRRNPFCCSVHLLCHGVHDCIFHDNDAPSSHDIHATNFLTAQDLGNRVDGLVCWVGSTRNEVVRCAHFYGSWSFRTVEFVAQKFYHLEGYCCIKNSAKGKMRQCIFSQFYRRSEVNKDHRKRICDSTRQLQCGGKFTILFKIFVHPHT